MQSANSEKAVWKYPKSVLLHGHELWLPGRPKDKQEMIKVLHAAVDRGVTFFDTAEVLRPLAQ